MNRRMVWIAIVVVLLVAASRACSTGGDDDDTDAGSNGNVGADTGDCVVVDIATSPEKLELLTTLAETFNESDEAELDGECVFVRVQRKSSGAAATLLAEGWDEESEGPRPVIWSPAASTWGAVLNQRLTEAGRPTLADASTPFMLTPLVIAMPRPMAEALGWPNTPLGFTDILQLARSGEGWAAFGHPEWGPFRLGKTNPNFSTSGLSALVAQAYAANGKTSGLSLEDLAKPSTSEFARGVESAVVHYGDTTLTFLNNLYRADQRRNPFLYVSAVAVEEKSVIDYNAGNPDGILDQGETPRPPRVPLVAIYPEEGTLYSDNPLIVLDAEWVDQREEQAAGEFVEFVQRPENQRRVLEFGFRPGNPEVAIGRPVAAANGVDPDQPETLLEVPEPEVLARLIDDWAGQRKAARVLLVIDVSGSMGDVGDSSTGDTKLDLAKRAAVDALDQFKDDDELGLWTFTTDQDGGTVIDRLIEPSRAGDVREGVRERIRGLFPSNGTPLYDVTQRAYEDSVASFAADRINAIVLLSDGRNDDGEDSDDRDQLDRLLTTLREGTEGENAKPVRVFPIAFGEGADLPILRRLAEATTAAAYDSSDPASIGKVFAAVVSNF